MAMIHHSAFATEDSSIFSQFTYWSCSFLFEVMQFTNKDKFLPHRGDQIQKFSMIIFFRDSLIRYEKILSSPPGATCAQHMARVPNTRLAHVKCCARA
ncbi:hypothetical protein TIFTF001_024517 [Ficus carica]|uniref:Uncharacterized protein n=1 Tax=Ficus carica TaxID=3494 RepID=A0AA88DEV3_FICCA|nr:hypothetical protein TIFTF001_024517 [Ficus carica]